MWGKPDAEIAQDEAIIQLRLKMADWLDRHEWGQGYLLGDGTACLIGSYFIVTHATADCRSTPELRTICRSMGFRDRHGAEMWNDRDCRTKQQVINRLRGLPYN